MDKILAKIKKPRLAIVLGVNWLIDILIGCILLFGLHKIEIEFMVCTLIVDALFAGIVYTFEVLKKNSRYDVFLKGIVVAKNIYLIFYYMEYFCGNIKNINPMDVRFWLNGLIYITVMVLLFSIFYWLPATVVAFNIFAFILLIVNLFLVDERGLPFFFADLFSIGTAMDVAENYTFREWPQYLCIFIWFLTSTIATIYVLKMQTKTKPQKKRWNILIRLCGFGFVFAVLSLFLKTSLMADCNIEPYFWKHTKNGVALNLMMDAKYSKLEKPADYDVKALEQLAADYAGTEGSGNTPNILVIMNESFADLSVLGDYETNQEVMPFINSLQENTIKGHVFSSVYGGSTADSEYEFLTGDSMIIYPNGAVPYQTYLKGTTFMSSLVRNIQISGYETASFHPNEATNWNRTNIYRALGFQRSLWIDDVQNPEYVRNYITDASDFDTVIAQFENKEKGKPLFLFNITMQNHGGYLIKKFENEIQVTSAQGRSYPKTEQFLTLAKMTDQEVEKLLQYFSGYEEPTIVLFYGDHHPKIDSKFIEDMLGGSMNNLQIEELQKLYQTPFFLWANYDIEEQQDVQISINYLSSLLCETAGLPMSGYQQYLSELREKYPVINGNGVIDAQGNYYNKTEALSEFPELNTYCGFIYNHMYDKKNYIRDFFEQ